MNDRAHHPLFGLSIAALALGLDQWSKQWALDRLEFAGARLALPGPVDVTLVFNRSNAFGLIPVAGELTRWGLAAIDLAVAAALTWVLVCRATSRPSAAGLALIIAGALGNTLDRVRLGAVIDFIDASKLGFVWIFNVADASIDAGAALLIFALLRTGTTSDE